jgi:hypothetical protein
VPTINLDRAVEDFPYYAKNALKIKTKDAALQSFVLNRPQRALWKRMKEDIDNEVPLRYYLLKARQMGFSTYTQGLLYWVTTTRPFRHSLVVSHEDRSAGGLFNKSEVFYRFSPEQLRPKTRQANRNELYFANPRAIAKDKGLESRILVQTANNKNLGASLTLDFLHLSELARYEELLNDVQASMVTLLQTVPVKPLTFVIVETTAQGMGYAKDWWDTPEDEDGYVKFFASWVASDEYTHAEPLSKDKLSMDPQSKWGHEGEVFEMVWREHEKWYPEITDDDERGIEALKRLAWRRRTLMAQFRGDLEFFKQEYPLTAEEAFITSGQQVFNTSKIVDMSYALKEPNGEPKNPPKTFRYHRGQKGFFAAPYGPLRVYEEPTPYGVYVLGGDVSEGIKDGDYSTLQVLKLPGMHQVAVYQDYIKPDDLADVAYALGELYKWGLLSIENNGPGIATNLRLRDNLHYPVMYTREIFDGRERQFTKKLGWSTNRATKPIMITALRGAIDDDLILLQDLPTLDELLHYVVRKDGTMGAMQGKHDDLLMALAVAVQAAVQRGELGERQVRQVVEGSFNWHIDQIKEEDDEYVIGSFDYGDYLT